MQFCKVQSHIRNLSNKVCSAKETSYKLEIFHVARERILKALIRQRNCVGWSVPFLFTCKKQAGFPHIYCELESSKDPIEICVCTCSSEPSLLADAVVTNFTKYCIRLIPQHSVYTCILFQDLQMNVKQAVFHFPSSSEFIVGIP